MENEIKETEKVIKLYKNQIKFKASQFFGNPPMNVVFSRLKLQPKANTDYKLILTMKRIREAYLTDGRLIDETIKEIQAKYVIDGKIPEEAIQAFNIEVNTYLLETEIDLPFEQLKMSDFQPLESLAELDVLDGIIEIDIED